MTVLTDNQGLILIAPDQDQTKYLLQLQYQQFQAYVDSSSENGESFLWLQPEIEEFE